MGDHVVHGTPETPAAASAAHLAAQMTAVLMRTQHLKLVLVVAGQGWPLKDAQHVRCCQSLK
jgi:hypothetical protein